MRLQSRFSKTNATEVACTANAGEFQPLWLTPAHLRIAAAERSISSSDVDQLETEIRMACMPCHVVALNQHVPSSCTLRTTSAVNASASPPPGGENRTSNWFRTTSLST